MNSAFLKDLVALRGRGPMHPLHAMLLAFPFPMFLGAYLSDLAYASSYQIQWSNFASWLIVGALLGAGFALLWTLIDFARDRRARTGRQFVFAGVLLLTFIIGFIDALVHGKDAWAIMPEAVWLSAIATLFAFVASWIGFAGLHEGDAS